MMYVPALWAIQPADDEYDLCSIIPDYFTFTAADYFQLCSAYRTVRYLSAPYIKEFFDPGL